MAFSFEKHNILVVGDVMLDKYWTGAATRISPEAPVPIVKLATEHAVLGGAANVAVNLKSLGADVHLLGLIGNDEDGKLCEQLLCEQNIQYYLPHAKQKPTISKLRIMSHKQQMLRLDREECFAKSNKDELFAQFLKLLPQADVVIASDYNKGTLSNIQQYIAAANKHNKAILIDPKGSDFAKYSGATLLSPNLKEFAAIVGPCDNQSILNKKAEALRQELNLTALLVTQGANGMTLLTANQQPQHEPSFSNEVIDVSGAGDTVLATFAFMLAGKKPMAHAMRMANMAAGIVVGKANTAQVTMHELIQTYSNKHPSAKGILSLEQLKIAITQEKLCGNKIVFTNGCFDILHAGHVAYLQKAKALGDKLIVAINSDASIKKLKGPTRPYAPLDSRLKVLEALKAVDWVIVFAEDTPERLIKELQPDVLAKGGDYKIDEIVGWEYVQSYGGEVVAVQHEYTHSINSSQILEGIAD